ncbi:Zinc finger CCCH domain-containing protein 5 isoform A [Glycine soja]|uniref:Zinc finger CCCH domain-containing protein 5 isoform A n=1 Tax=Glycine soja TaxID=3848 RepID=A0A445GXX5_GLYSO|nr:Zinc finger CCCH domain-containing protein 5 isoform A [Glycine soja]
MLMAVDGDNGRRRPSPSPPPFVNQHNHVSHREDRNGGEGFDGRSKSMSREEKRKAMKKMKRKQARKEASERERREEEERLIDPEEQRQMQLLEQQEAERMQRDMILFQEREKEWMDTVIARKQQQQQHQQQREEEDEDDEFDCVEEEGPPEIIWQGNEIIFKKKQLRVRVTDKDKPKPNETNQNDHQQEDNRPTSNPLPPDSTLENVAQQIPNFGTEQDKAHCPFHLKTGACCFGIRCSRVHFYPDKSSTFLIKNMYNGPGLACDRDQDEGLEVCSLASLYMLMIWPWLVKVNDISCCVIQVLAYGAMLQINVHDLQRVSDCDSKTLKMLIQSVYKDEEVERCFEEFYEDVHTEFLKFGEVVNFKVCKNGSFHWRGNVYVQYKSLDSALLAYNSVNGRYFAGKQVSCQFVNLTRWKVAICGEYMKSGFKTCSHGTACNFIHCFRNPGGDYEWADSDKPPPKFWVKKMITLFGFSDDYETSREQGNLSLSKTDSDRSYHSRRRSRSRETTDQLKCGH